MVLERQCHLAIQPRGSEDSSDVCPLMGVDLEESFGEEEPDQMPAAPTTSTRTDLRPWFHTAEPLGDTLLRELDYQQV